MLPELCSKSNHLPLGRYLTTVGELQDRFVEAHEFAESGTRKQIFNDWLTSVEMLRDLGSDLLEATWIGGSFTSGKLNPDDLDCLFLLNGVAFHRLPSNRRRQKVLEFGKQGRLRETTGLRVDAFVLVREEFANYWHRNGVTEESQTYLSKRGAWDDWFLRINTKEHKEDPPKAEDARPRRGYVEVRWT